MNYRKYKKQNPDTWVANNRTKNPKLFKDLREGRVKYRDPPNSMHIMNPKMLLRKGHISSNAVNPDYQNYHQVVQFDDIQDRQRYIKESIWDKKAQKLAHKQNKALYGEAPQWNKFSASRINYSVPKKVKSTKVRRKSFNPVKIQQSHMHNPFSRPPLVLNNPIDNRRGEGPYNLYFLKPENLNPRKSKLQIAARSTIDSRMSRNSPSYAQGRRSPFARKNSQDNFPHYQVFKQDNHGHMTSNQKAKVKNQRSYSPHEGQNYNTDYKAGQNYKSSGVQNREKFIKNDTYRYADPKMYRKFNYGHDTILAPCPFNQQNPYIAQQIQHSIYNGRVINENSNGAVIK